MAAKWTCPECGIVYSTSTDDPPSGATICPNCHKGELKGKKIRIEE
jgi:rubredoxin